MHNSILLDKTFSCLKTPGHAPGVLVYLISILFAGNVAAQELQTVVLELQTQAQEAVVDGVVEAVNQATISAQTSGRIQAIYYDVNDFVPKASIIMRFRDTDQQAGVTSAQASLGEAKARLVEAESEFKRIQDVFQKQLVAKSALDKAEADFKAAQQKTTIAEAKLKQAQEELEHTVVRAPYDGILVKRFVEPGELAKSGQQLVSGFSLDKLRVTAQVPQYLVASLRKNTPARIITGDHSLPVTQLTIYPFANEQTHSFQVRAYFDSEQGGLYPGMFIKVAFAVGDEQVLLAPVEAVVRRSEVTGVYVLAEDGSIRFRQIRVGKQIDNKLLILSGLVAGESIAINPIKAGILRKETN